jgi:hypothetical protein
VVLVRFEESMEDVDGDLGREHEGEFTGELEVMLPPLVRSVRSFNGRPGLRLDEAAALVLSPAGLQIDRTDWSRRFFPRTLIGVDMVGQPDELCSLSSFLCCALRCSIRIFVEMMVRDGSCRIWKTDSESYNIRVGSCCERSPYK